MAGSMFPGAIGLTRNLTDSHVQTLQFSRARFRAISRDILEFRARVLPIQAASCGYGRAVPIPDTVLPVY